VQYIGKIDAMLRFLRAFAPEAAAEIERIMRREAQARA